MTRQSEIDQRFIALVDCYLDRVYRYLLNLTRDEDTARELSHETFLKLHKAVSGGKRPDEGYVFTVARNTALSGWRSRRRESDKREAWRRETAPAAGSGAVAAAANPGTAPTLDVERRELGEALEQALQSLPEEQRTVFLLSEIEGMKYERIGEVLDISPGTVASRKFNAVRALRGELERSGHALP